jgi:hypothetical protein
MTFLSAKMGDWSRSTIALKAKLNVATQVVLASGSSLSTNTKRGNG